MLTVLTTIFGFLGPFLPEIIKLFRQKQDNAHELAMLSLQAENAKADHLYKMEEITTKGDIQESIVLHQPAPSFGVQILDAAKDWPKILVIPVFYLFAFLDFISGMVRPAVTYAMVGFYLFYKWALFQVASLDHATWSSALLSIWTESDFSVLLMTLAYWFGGRIVKAHFGGSASTGKAGGG